MSTTPTESRTAQGASSELIHVLVVDDVPVMAEHYAYDLKRVGGFHTLVAASGADALDILSREPVDCVVLDLEMPGIDGFFAKGRTPWSATPMARRQTDST